MNHTTTDEFTVLHALRVRGMAGAEAVRESAGLDLATTQGVLDAATSDGLAKLRTGGRVEGYLLTGAGRARHSALSEELITPEERAGLVPAYEAFLAPNRDLKDLTTAWQTETDGDASVVLARLEAVHEEVSAVLTAAAGAVPRMASYLPRFEAALKSFAGGDGQALARPMSGSYHDVWMELHEDLLLTLGRERTDDDG